MSDTWYYADQNKQVGPFSIQQLKATLLNIPNARNVLVWRPGFADWMKAGDVPELSADISAPPLAPFAERAAPFASAGAAGAATPAPQPTLVELFFSFQGRANRAKFWGIGLLNAAIMGVAFFGMLMTNSVVAWVVLGLAAVAAIVSGYAVGARRLHDRDKSAWWLLVYYLLPGLISPAGAVSSSVGFIALLGLVSLGISIAAFVDLGCLRGTIGDNRFGPDPLAGRY